MLALPVHVLYPAVGGQKELAIPVFAGDAPTWALAVPVFGILPRKNLDAALCALEYKSLCHSPFCESDQTLADPTVCPQMFGHISPQHISVAAVSRRWTCDDLIWTDLQMLAICFDLILDDGAAPELTQHFAWLVLIHLEILLPLS